jgi:hypothetical protein
MLQLDYEKAVRLVKKAQRAQRFGMPTKRLLDAASDVYNYDCVLRAAAELRSQPIHMKEMEGKSEANTTFSDERRIAPISVIEVAERVMRTQRPTGWMTRIQSSPHCSTGTSKEFTLYAWYGDDSWCVEVVRWEE